MRQTMLRTIAASVALEIHQLERPNEIVPARGWAAANIVRNAIESDEKGCRPSRSTAAHQKEGSGTAAVAALRRL